MCCRRDRGCFVAMANIEMPLMKWNLAEAVQRPTPTPRAHLSPLTWHFVTRLSCNFILSEDSSGEMISKAAQRVSKKINALLIFDDLYSHVWAALMAMTAKQSLAILKFRWSGKTLRERASDREKGEDKAGQSASNAKAIYFNAFITGHRAFVSFILLFLRERKIQNESWMIIKPSSLWDLL